MIFLDMKTIVFSNVITDIVCLAVIVSLWRQNRTRFAGTGLFAVDFALQTAALLLIILRGTIPDWMSFVAANTMVIAGSLLGYMGLTRFTGKQRPQIHNYILLAVFAFIHTWFTFVHPDLEARNINLSAGLLIICGQCAWLMLYGVEPGRRQLTRGVGIVFAAYCAVSVIRIVEFFADAHTKNDYFQSGMFDQLILISYQMLFILLTYSLALMFNKSLLMDVKTQEEKFSKAFHSSPYAISITRLTDGQIIEVNESFLNITGYQSEEIRGKTTPALHLWARDEDRALVVSELSGKGKVQEREFQFRKKSGEMITGLFSADIITINGEKSVLSSINDITGRKQADEKIHEISERLHLATVSAKAGVWDWNLQTSEMIWDDRMFELYGLTRENFHGGVEAWERGLHPDDSFRAIEECQAALRGERDFDTDFRVLRPDGVAVHIKANGVVLRDDKGKPLRMIGLNTDITERKQMELQIRERMKELRAFYNLSEIIERKGITQDELYEEFVKIIPASWKYAEVACARIVIGDKEFRTENFAESQWMQSAPVKVNEKIAGRIDIGYLEKRPEHDEGPFQKEERQLIDALAERLGHIIERRRMEIALRESECLTSEIIEKMNEAQCVAMVGSWDWNLQTNHVWWSDETYRIFGVTPKSFTPSFEQNTRFIHPDDLEKYNKTFEHCLQTGEPLDVDLRLVSPEGRLKYCHAKAQIFFDDSGQKSRFIGTVMDITERKLAEEAVLRMNVQLETKVAERTRELHDSQLALLNLVDDLNQSAKSTDLANRKLEEANTELSAFSYSVSHDLRAPLRSIDGFSRMLLEDYQEKLDDTGRKYLNKIRAATQHMGLLIDDMLKLSRITHAEFHQELINLSEMVRSVSDTFQQNNPDRDMKMTIQEGILIKGDFDSMQIALTNLVENAWKFTAKQKQPLIEFGMNIMEGKKVFFIRDNGAGFDMAFVNKLFGAFQRLHSADEFPGTGIGLATVKRVITRHGGQIWAEGEVGKGATFFFTLPE